MVTHLLQAGEPGAIRMKVTGRVFCSALLLASMAAAQQIQPGTLAAEADLPNADAANNTAGTSSSVDRGPITGKERVDWAVRGTIGPESLAGELFGAGWDTLVNHPAYYGPHWDGFADRFGVGLSGLALSNTMEAGFGAIWDEDPRYRRDEGAPFGHRLGHTVKMTFMAENRDGQIVPAYARFIAIPGNNFISNAWRAPGDDNVNQALIRTGLGFIGRWGNNTFDEFWPDFKRKIFHHHSSVQ
jgi:hypothetical protein